MSGSVRTAALSLRISEPIGNCIFSVNCVGPPRSQRFVLATKANGFFAVIEDELGELLGDLDDIEVAGEFSEDELIATISERLGLGAGLRRASRQPIRSVSISSPMATAERRP